VSANAARPSSSIEARGAPLAACGTRGVPDFAYEPTWSKKAWSAWDRAEKEPRSPSWWGGCSDAARPWPKDASDAWPWPCATSIANVLCGCARPHDRIPAGGTSGPERTGGGGARPHPGGVGYELTAPAPSAAAALPPRGRGGGVFRAYRGARGHAQSTLFGFTTLDDREGLRGAHPASPKLGPRPPGHPVGGTTRRPCAAWRPATDPDLLARVPGYRQEIGPAHLRGT
jgi:hypothetical protein